MEQDIHYHPKGRKGDTVRKYWTEARLKRSWANSKLCLSVLGVEALFRSPTRFSFVKWNTLLPLGLLLLSLYTPC